jgi:hypothetical protein
VTCLMTWSSTSTTWAAVSGLWLSTVDHTLLQCAPRQVEYCHINYLVVGSTKWPVVVRPVCGVCFHIHTTWAAASGLWLPLPIGLAAPGR